MAEKRNDPAAFCGTRSKQRLNNDARSDLLEKEKAPRNRSVKSPPKERDPEAVRLRRRQVTGEDAEPAVPDGRSQREQRGRPVRSDNRFFQKNDRRSNDHRSLSRIKGFSVAPCTGAARQIERSYNGGQQVLSKRTLSQPNLFNIGRNCQDSDVDRRKDDKSKKQRPRTSHRLDYRGLDKILQMEPSDIVMILAAPGSGLTEFLNEQETSDPLTSITLDVLDKACSSRTNRQNLQHLLMEVKESQFLKSTVPLFIMNLGSQKDHEKVENNMAMLQKIVNLYMKFLRVFPFSAVVVVSLAIALLEAEFVHMQQEGFDIPEETNNALKNLQRMIADLKDKKREGTLRSDNYTLLAGDQDRSDVESFRHMSVFPTYQDVHAAEQPFMRPNIVTAKFENSNTYLDTHFRLLREDFVKPLRDGIAHLLSFSGKDLSQGRFDDIWIYFDAHILSPICTPKGILQKVQFNYKKLKGVNWENSKRLIYGALVCLSMDNFETMIFATVANRDLKDLCHGIVTLHFNEENRQRLANVSQKDTFLMVETTAFFEAYRHVLTGLQEMDGEDLPMQKYIVRCEVDISPPSYLTDHKCSYSLLAMTNNRPLKRDVFSFQARQRRLQLADLGDINDILNFNDWPSKEELNLDHSQMEAVKLALTKELAIIQGPPGTGKTYVGLKIVKTLLDNADVWRSGAASPILVVCYTNHALDQFLMGILSFMQNASGLIRVGGRSASEVLRTLSLSNHRRKDHFKNNLPGHMRAMYANLKDERVDIEKEMGEKAALFESSAKGILERHILGEYIVSLHGVTLEEGEPYRTNLSSSRNGKGLMLEWLGVSILSKSSGNTKNPDHASDGSCNEGLTEERLSVASSGMVETGQDKLSVSPSDATGDEEVELEQAERMMEGDNVEKHLQNARRTQAAVQKEALAYVVGEDQEETDDGGWMINKEAREKLKKRVKQELMRTDHMLEEEARSIRDLWSLSYKERWHLYRLWLSKYRADIRAIILTLENQYQGIVNRMDELRNLEDETILRDARVIGMTTTCAARCRNVLQNIRPRIVVVEEAAEVLEAHIVTTLTSACQHLILIGDHQQLRPSATVYELAKNFNLEVSLFERLIGMKIPYVRLDYQHRMRPEIAQLLTPHIYDKLLNHDSVNLYENIKGVTTNVFFVDHKHLEENIAEGRSHQNIHEAKFVKALCEYLMCQGYKPAQITVLTTYTGQLFCLKKIMPQNTAVKLCVVDRYQGEENDIIILSLVRSNIEGKVGFLKISNRVCVALSRAKKGLFCIGNMTMLSTIPLWSKIVNVLSSHGQVGEALMLRCENHPATITPVSKAQDFFQVPLGGCSLPCEYRLDCGHSCTRLCHPYDADHKEFKCVKPCVKTLCQDGHICPKPCFAECGKCQVIVTKMIPKCGHEQEVFCSHPAESFICRVPCNKILLCGHSCVRSCGETCTKRCPQLVKVDLDCGHQKLMLCHEKQEAEENKAQIKCLVKCDTDLHCGHACSGTCSQCIGGVTHVPCVAKCEVQLICSHYCAERCGKGCVPCSRPCEMRCYHQKCKKRCNEECRPCRKECGWVCKHHRCTKLCCEPCDRPPCQEPCRKKLNCGHRCIGMCGEPCPSKCCVCHADEVQELFFGKEADSGALFVQLLDCGHMFEVTGFDSWMALPKEDEVVRIKSCPKCSTPIFRSVRYSSVVKQMWLDIQTVKRKATTLHIQKYVKEREEKGIQSLLIPPLLSKLTDPALDTGRAEIIHRQIVLLSQLAEMKRNAVQLPLHLQSQIHRDTDSCSDRVARAEHESLLESEREVMRILVLAEAKALSDKLVKSSKLMSLLYSHRLNGILSKLNDGKSVVKEQDFQQMQRNLDGIAEKLKPFMRWKGLEETSSNAIDCAFIKLNHWSKCSKGHIYYNHAAEDLVKNELCAECSVV